MYYDYSFTVESEDEIKTVQVEAVYGLGDAREVLRQKYPYEQWRIINIAAVPELPIES